jgi:hypothetical protein
MSVVGFFRSKLYVDCTLPKTQRASDFESSDLIRTSGQRSRRNAPVLTAISIESALMKDCIRTIRERGTSPALEAQYDHHQARLDVLFSQVER